MYSWYPPNVLMVSPNVLNIPQCTHCIPPMYWTFPDVLMIPMSTSYSSYIVHVLNLSRCTHDTDEYPPPPRCTHSIPPMYWTSLDVLMVSLWCTKHPPMYWIHIIQGDSPTNFLLSQRWDQIIKIKAKPLKILRAFAPNRIKRHHQAQTDKNIMEKMCFNPITYGEGLVRTIRLLTVVTLKCLDLAHPNSVTSTFYPLGTSWQNFRKITSSVGVAVAVF